MRTQRETFAFYRLLELNYRHHLVLQPLMTKPTQGGVKMKTRKIVFCVVLTLGILRFLTSCTTTKTPLPQSVDAYPLHDAAKEGNLEEIRRLLKSGTDVNMSGYRGWTALHWAVHSKHKDVVELLISSGASIDVKANDNKTPLHVAAERGPKDIAELLIEEGADIGAVDSGYEGGTPLHWAAFRGQKAVAELLIERGADINLKDKLGLTPLDLAVRYGGEDVAEVLRQHGALE